MSNINRIKNNKILDICNHDIVRKYKLLNNLIKNNYSKSYILNNIILDDIIKILENTNNMSNYINARLNYMISNYSYHNFLYQLWMKNEFIDYFKEYNLNIKKIWHDELIKKFNEKNINELKKSDINKYLQEIEKIELDINEKIKKIIES